MLAERFRLDRLALGRDAQHIAAHRVDLALAAVLRQPDDVLHGLCANGFSSACHRQQRRNRACSDGHAFVLAGDFQLGSAADDRDVQFALDLLDVFVKCTEYCHQQFRLLDLHYLFYGYTLLCLISN